jgi:four helix bundle protein
MRVEKSKGKKQEMNTDRQRKRFDLEDRTFNFAQSVRAFMRRLPRTICNQEDVRQLARSSGSVGANYIEANSALGRKDFVMRIRIARKEAKESTYWLRLLDTQRSEELDAERDGLVQESIELMKIFGAILKKSLPAEKV